MRIFHRLVPVFFIAFAFMALTVSGRAAVDVSLSVAIAPPALPVYVQPVIPDEGYIWMPGYWAWGPTGYYWVPGTWVLPPRVGLLWTPGYWAWRDSGYFWHAGYWGPHVGYYGGINYGFGYIGVGFFGGFWDHDHYHYNSAVNNFGDTHITNVYRQTTVNNTTIINNTNVRRVSFNGGQGGTTARPNAAEQSAEHEQHVPPTDLQRQHEQTASANRALLSSVNHGRPAIAATPHPAAFTERGTVGARGSNGAPRNASGGPQNAARPSHHAAGQAPQGPHVATAAGSQRPPHRQPGQPGGPRPQGGPPHPMTHQANATPHPGPAPQNRDAHTNDRPDNGPHPENRGPEPH